MSNNLAPVLVGGGVGVAGTLLGAFVNDVLTRRREARAAKARQRRAVNAVVGELLDALSIIDRAARRQAWWPPGDAPRDLAWQTYNDDLAAVLDDDGWHRVRMTYETLRSLDAIRDQPTRRWRRTDRYGQRWSWEPRWPDANAAAEDSWSAVNASLELLRPHHHLRPSQAIKQGRLKRAASAVSPSSRRRAS